MPRPQKGASNYALGFLYQQYWSYKLALAKFLAGVKPTYTHEWEAYLGAADMYMMIYGADEYDKVRARVEDSWLPEQQASIDELVAHHVTAWTEAHGHPPKPFPIWR